MTALIAAVRDAIDAHDLAARPPIAGIIATETIPPGATAAIIVPTDEPGTVTSYLCLNARDLDALPRELGAAGPATAIYGIVVLDEEQATLALAPLRQLHAAALATHQ